MGYPQLGIVSMPPDISQHHVTSRSTILYWHFGNTVVLGTFCFYLLFLFLSAESPFTHEHYSVIVWTEHTTVQNTNKTDNKFIQKWVRQNKWKVLSGIPPFFREGSVIFVFPPQTTLPNVIVSYPNLQRRYNNSNNSGRATKTKKDRDSTKDNLYADLQVPTISNNGSTMTMTMMNKVNPSSPSQQHLRSDNYFQQQPHRTTNDYYLSGHFQPSSFERAEI